MSREQLAMNNRTFGSEQLKGKREEGKGIFVRYIISEATRSVFKQRYLLPSNFSLFAIIFCLLFAAACDNSNENALKVINIAVIEGIGIPESGYAPVRFITETTQYTGTVIWSPDRTQDFAKSTIYTAIITLTEKPGYTLEGVPEDFFSIEGAVMITNAANSGIIVAVFPQTEDLQIKRINIAEIQGLYAIFGMPPVAAITPTEQFTGTVTWSPNHSIFARGVVYTAVINLTAVQGYTFKGVEENFFTVTGAISANNNKDSGIITAVFPEIPSAIVSIYIIPGIIPPAAGAQPVRSISTAEYTGVVAWEPSVIDVFDYAVQYTAIITLTTEQGFTTNGVPVNFFTVEGAAASNSAGSNVVTAVFPETEPEDGT